MEHHKADVRQVAALGASGDDPARFLRELRQLRDGAGLGHAELAARAHYPYDAIRAAEVGPTLPDLPVLSAFVRGCGGTTEEWEERWRALTQSPSLPVAATRQTGQSDAATAGARINSATQTGDGPDPSIIMAALNRVAEVMASPPAPKAAASGATKTAAGAARTSAGAAKAPAGEKTNGWDPIRVSSAWPMLKHTPTTAGPAADASAAGGAHAADDAGTSSGVGAPWDTAPATGMADADQAPAAGTGGVPASHGSRRQTSRTTVVVVAVVLLCVLIALLAVLA